MVLLMALALGFVLSTLRQAFAGSVLVASPMGASEDLLRSLLGIVVALAFLAWGWWRKQRRWRVGSLVLMLGAVAKVFLIDATGQTTVMTNQIVELLGTRGGNWEILATAAFVSIAVPLLVFFAMQKYLVRGLLAGSVK